MAEIIKHVNDSLYCIRHALRELPPGKMHGNEDIDTTLTQRKTTLFCMTDATLQMKQISIEKILKKKYSNTNAKDLSEQ